MNEKNTAAPPRVRPVRPDDLDAMRDICVETSSLPLRGERDRRFLLLMYCDPYAEYFPDDCFVAVDEEDRPVGYILCAADTRGFFRLFRREVLPEIDKLGFSRALGAKAVCAQQTVCSVFAPAHLHIDLTASARRRGTGTALMNALKDHLASKGIDRVQLTCGSKNKPAISFYRKNGFHTVLRVFGSCVMRSNTACGGRKNKE